MCLVGGDFDRRRRRRFLRDVDFSELLQLLEPVCLAISSMKSFMLMSLIFLSKLFLLLWLELLSLSSQDFPPTSLVVGGVRGAFGLLPRTIVSSFQLRLS